MKQGPLYDDIIFQSSSEQFQCNTSQPNSNRNFYNSCYFHFKRSKLILYLIFQNSKIFISLVMSLSSSCVKKTQSCISRIKRERKTESNIWWNFLRSLLLRSLSQNTAVLTPVVMLLTKNWVKKGPNLYFMYQW